MTTWPRPDATNTGPRWAHPRLRYTGPTTITTDTRISRRAITGSFIVQAGATLEVWDSTWTPQGVDRVGYAFRTRDGGRVVLRYCHLDGQDRTVQAASYSHTDVQWCELVGFEDPIRTATDNLIRHNRIHGLSRSGPNDPHPDCVQHTGGTDVDVSWNTLDCRGLDGVDMGNACLMLGNENHARYPDSTVERFMFAHNWCDGGNYAVNTRADPGVLDVQVRDNVFGGTHRYGPMLLGPTVTESGNTISGPAPARRVKT